MDKNPLIVRLKHPKTDADVQPEALGESNEVNEAATKPPRGSMRQKRKTPYLMVIAVLVVLVLGGGYAVYENEFSGTLSTESVSDDAERPAVPETESEESESVSEEADDLVAEIGKLILLPSGEHPTVATVTDPEELKDQPFFANAKTGDMVLLYTEARKAYLYDPHAKKIIEVAPITAGE